LHRSSATPLGTSHRVTLENLQPGATYHYRIVVRGPAQGVTPDATFVAQASGSGGGGPPSGGQGVSAPVLKLRGYRATITGAGLELQSAVISGGAANTPLPVPGIRPRDALVAVLEFQPIPIALPGQPTPVIVEEHSAIATVLPGAVQLSRDTSGNQLLIVWWSVYR
ncbi:MAG: hypothetical protein C4346_14135, partial [Chloroflexota bacterium]